MKSVKNVLAGCLASVLSAQAATTITGQAYDTASIGLQSGSALTSGVVSMGFYNVAPTRSLFEGYTSAASFLNNFTSIASNPTGIDTYQALFSVTKEVPTGDASFDAKQIYLLVGNGSTIANSTQLGVFTDASWITAANPSGPTPLAQSFEISSLNGDIKKILFGSYVAAAGEYASDGVVNEYRLQAVIPEPSSLSLLALGGGLALLRRRHSNQK